MTPSFLDGSHAHATLRVRLRSVALKLTREHVKKGRRKSAQAASDGTLRTVNLFDVLPDQFQGHTFLAKSHRDIGMETVGETRRHLASLRA